MWPRGIVLRGWRGNQREEDNIASLDVSSCRLFYNSCCGVMLTPIHPLSILCASYRPTDTFSSTYIRYIYTPASLCNAVTICQIGIRTPVIMKHFYNNVKSVFITRLHPSISLCVQNLLSWIQTSSLRICFRIREGKGIQSFKTRPLWL